MASSRIFVKGLPPSITEAEFRKHFSAKGREITDVKLIPQRRIGYVGYKTPDDASKAIKYFHKSYIRMSKIAVEAAKPVSSLNVLTELLLMECQISDPALSNKGQNALHSNYASRGNSSSNNASKGFTSAAEQESGSKKRKRDEPNVADPKLREFLQVMKSGREGVMDDVVNAEIGGESSGVPAPALPEEESDDEYEQIPARREKLRRIDPPETIQTTSSRQLQPMEASAISDSQSSPPKEGAGSTETKPTNLEQPDVSATDDDWLRSRTNRLLDLVDPDDLEPTTAQDSTEGTVQREADESNKTSHADESVSNDVAMDQDVAEEPAENPTTDETLDAIHRTSRLFIRNLPYSATEDDLRETFEKFGHLEEVRDDLVNLFCM